GRQAYVIYPVIDESERADLKAATTMAEDLREVFAEFRVGLVHGRLKAEERDATMRAFRDNAVQILVATSVIEVGIDVANATVMLIEHAERFGLAQLHQLRGRVGRGECGVRSVECGVKRLISCGTTPTSTFRIPHSAFRTRTSPAPPPAPHQSVRPPSLSAAQTVYSPVPPPGGSGRR